MNYFALPHRAVIIRGVATVALSYASMGIAFGQSMPAQSAEDALLAGVQYVPPAFVAGEKVRTPESVAAALVQDLAKRLVLPGQTVSVGLAKPDDVLAAGKARVLLVPVGDPEALAPATRMIPTGYSSGAMAIMRNDTDIKTWEQLKGRTVCLAEGGRYSGQISARYGAVEKSFRAPADSLLALRIGGCDAAVHDSAILNELIKLPEWKKFSARLPVRDMAPLAIVISSSDPLSRGALSEVTRHWADSAYLQKLTTSAARDIAFEVYLDQTVTDCH